MAENWWESDPVVEEKTPDDSNWWEADPVVDEAPQEVEEGPTKPPEPPPVLQQYNDAANRYKSLSSAVSQNAEKYNELSSLTERTPEQEEELTNSWQSILESQANLSKDAVELERLQPQYDQYFADQEKARYEATEELRLNPALGGIVDQLHGLDKQQKEQLVVLRESDETDDVKKKRAEEITTATQAQKKQLIDGAMEQSMGVETTLNEVAQALREKEAAMEKRKTDILVGSAAATLTAGAAIPLVKGAVESEARIEAEAQKKIDGILANVPEEQREQYLQEAEAINKLVTGDAKTAIVNNELRISPTILLDDEAVQAAIDSSIGTDREKRTLRKNIPQMQRNLAKQEIPIFNELSEFRDFVEERGLENASDVEKIKAYKAYDGNWFGKLGAQAKINIQAGYANSIGQVQTVFGTAADLIARGTGSETARSVSDAFIGASMDQADEVEKLTRMSQAVGGPQIVGEIARIGTEMLPVVATGGLTGLGVKAVAATGVRALTPTIVANAGFVGGAGAAGLQSYAGVYSDATRTLRDRFVEEGMGQDEATDLAMRQAYLPAVLAGITTAALTLAGGKTGVEAVFRLGQNAAFKGTVTSFYRDLAKNIAIEGLLEEGPDELIQGMIAQATYNPNMSLGEIIEGAAKATALGGFFGGSIGAATYGIETIQARKAIAARQPITAFNSARINALEGEVKNFQTENPLGGTDGRTFDIYNPSEKAAGVGAKPVDKVKIEELSTKRAQLTKMLADEKLSSVTQNDVESELAQADYEYVKLLAQGRNNILTEQILDKIDALPTESTDAMRGILKIANNMGAETLTGRERVALGITKVGTKFIAANESPLIKAEADGTFSVTDAGKQAVEQANLLPLSRMIGISEGLRSQLEEQARVEETLREEAAEREARKAAEDGENNRLGPESSEALKNQINDLPEKPEGEQAKARLAELLRQQEEQQRKATEALQKKQVEGEEPLAPTEPTAPENLEPLRRVARAGQTPEDITALTEAGLIEIYKDQPVITEAGMALIPEAERPRLTPEARKIQIDTGSSAVVAEAISKGLRIGVDQVGPNVTMPQGWTIEGDIYVPPAPPTEPPVEPEARPVVDAATLNPRGKQANKILTNAGVDPETAAFVAQQYQDEAGEMGAEEWRAFILDKFEENGGVIPAQMRYSEDQKYYEMAFGVGPEEAATMVENAKTYNQQAAQEELEQNKKWRRKDETKATQAQQGVGVAAPAEGVTVPARGKAPRPAIEGRGVPVAPAAPEVGAITEEQANNVIREAQEARAKKQPRDVPVKGRVYGSLAPKETIGKTVREALLFASRLNLSKIAAANPNEIMMQDVAAILAQLDMPLLDTEMVASLASQGYKGRAARITKADGTSVIGMPSTLRQSVEILAHEVGHTLTGDQIRKYLPRRKIGRGKPYLDEINKVIADPNTPEAISRLFSLYVSTIEQLGITEQYFGAKGIAGGPKADTSRSMARKLQAKGELRKDLDGDVLYGLANMEEFVSQTFSEPAFRELLKTLKDPTNPQRTLWQAFVDAIQRVLQLPKGSMAAAVIQASVDVGMTVPSARVQGQGVSPAPEVDMAPEPEEAPTGIVEGQEVQLEGGDLLRAMKTQSETQYAGKIGRISGKEIFQNSVDAIMKITPQQEAQRGVPKAIYVGTQPKFFRSKLSMGERANLENRITSDDQTTDETINLRGDDLIVYDTGTGMTPSVVIDKFLRAFVSGKTVGEGGGFGQAKLAFLGGSKYFKVATVAEDANGKKYVTILEGAGDAFYLFNMKPPKVVLRPMTKITLAAPANAIPMTLEYFEVPPETITGTAIVSEIVGGYSDGAKGGKDFISDMVKYVDGISFLDMDSVQQQGTRSDRGTFHIYPTSRNTPLEFLGFSTPDVSNLNPIKMEFGLLKSVDLPSATIDFLARANDAYGKRTYISAKVLNRSIYQFNQDIYFDEEVSLPNEVVVNIKPKVEAGSKDYPFTTSRENLSGNVASEVSEYFKNVGREAIKKLNAQFDSARKSAVPIPNSKQAFLDVGQNNDTATLNSIASAPSTIAINEDIAFGQDTILRTLNTMYPNKFGRASYAGFITGGRSFGVHFGNRVDPSTIWHDPWLQLSRAKDTWRDSSMGDIFDIDFDTATDQEINDFYDFYLRQSYGVSFHEALHQIIDEEGEGLARELTFRTGDLLYGFLTSTIPNNKTTDEKRAILKELETNAATLAANVNQTIASQFITAQGGYSGYALAERGREEGAATEAGRVLPAEGTELAPEEEFEIIPEQVEDQIEGTPEAATINVMGQAFQMANEQSAAMGTPEGTLPLETITSAWMNSGRDVETLENAIIRYTNLEPEAAATLAQAIGKQVEIQRGIMEISDAASRRKAEKEEEPEVKPYSFAQRIKEELPPDMRSKVSLAYEVLRNEVSVEEANRVMSGLTLDEAIKATEDMNNGVSMPVRSMMAQIVLRKIMDRRKSTRGKKGKEADYKAVVQAHVEFHDFINDYFKELGQGVQAISRFADLGADGVLLKVRRDIDKAISKHIKNRKGQIDQIKRDVEDADNAAFNAAVKSNKANIDKTAKKAGEQEAKKLTIEEQAQKLAIRAAKKVAGEEVRRRQPDPLSDLVNGHLRRYNANFIAEATAMGVSPVTAQAIEDSAKKLRDSRQATKSERERFKEMQDERMRVKKELARENKYIYGPRPTIWENYQDMFSERLARRLMRDPKKKVPPSLLLFTDRLTENLLGFVPEAERQATTQRSFQAMIEDALNNKEKYQEAFNRALEDISLKVMELEVREAAGEKISSATYKKAVAAQEFLQRLEPIIQQFPVSDKLILRFVNQKMKAMGESLVGKYNDWYRSSRKTRIEIEKALAEKLVADLNVSDVDAANLSIAIVKDFRAKAEERREKALARFKKPKEKTKPLAQSPLKKFFELVNIGAMTDQDAYEVMAHRFELPTWDPKFAKQIEEMALIIQDMPEGMERRRLTRNMMGEIARRKGFSLSDLGSGFFYSNMLSSVETFLINFYDTLLGNWVNGLASSVADKDFARFNGLVAGYRKGWSEAVQVFQTGLRINMPRLEEKTPLTVELINYGRKGGVALESTEGMNAIAKTLLESPPAKVLNLWKYVTRIMEATDALNYTASSEGQRYAEAAKMAKDEGLEGKAKQKRISQILNLGDDVYQAALKQAEQEGYTGNDAKFRAMEIQDNEIDAELREKSFDRALTDVYRNMPTGLAGFMAAQFNNLTMRIANPWFRNAFKLFTAPFVITPTNLFNRWLDYSPYGYKRLFYGSGNLLDKDTPYYVAPPKGGSAEFYTQALKASSSVMVMGLAYGLTKAGLLVLRGMGPSDEEERKQWLDDNNRPHTFSFMGGPQISYQFSPWALVLSWMANSMNWEQYNAKPDSGSLERGFVGMKFAIGVIMDLPFFAGPAEFMDVIQKTRGDAVATPLKYVEGKMGMVYPNLVRQIDRFFDPTIYDSQGLKGVIIDQMPFARRLGTQRVNLFGDPIGEDRPTMDRLVGRIISFPTNPSRESRILAKYDIYPYMPSPQRAKALVDGEQAQMTEEQYNKFVQIVGKDVKKRINDLFDPDAEITEKEKERGKKRISQIFERARARAVREVSTY